MICDLWRCFLPCGFCIQKLEFRIVFVVSWSLPDFALGHHSKLKLANQLRTLAGFLAALWETSVGAAGPGCTLHFFCDTLVVMPGLGSPDEPMSGSWD